MEIPTYCIIIGAPQFLLGSYLEEHFEEEMVKYIMGKSDKKSIAFLDDRLKNKILNNYTYKPKVYIHYSTKEHTYIEHVKGLLEVLNREKFEVFSDIKDYTDHSEVSRFFPDFLLNTLEKVLDCNKNEEK